MEGLYYFGSGGAGNGALDVLHVADNSTVAGRPMKLQDGLNLGSHGAIRKLSLHKIPIQFRRWNVA
jgi:hypothetical protein